MTNEDNKKNALSERQQTMKRLNKTIGTPDKWIKYLSHLNFKEQFALLSYFGLNGFKQSSLEELAEATNSSLTTVRGAFNKACRKIEILQNEQTNPRYQYLFLYSNEVLTPENYEALLSLSRKEKIAMLNKNIISGEDVGLEMVKNKPELFTDNLKYFSEKERYLIQHLLGLNGNEKLTSAQICEDLGISQHFFTSLKLGAIKKLTQMENLINQTGSIQGFTGREYAITHEGGAKATNSADAPIRKITYYANHPELVNPHLSHLSIGEQYSFLRYTGINEFEKMSPAQIAVDLKVNRSTCSNYATSAVRKLDVLNGETDAPDVLEKLLKRNFPILTTENYNDYVGLSSQDKYSIGVCRGKPRLTTLEQEQQRCDKYREIAYSENAEFMGLLDQVIDGKDHKMMELLRIIEKNKRLTNNQCNYLFSLYNIERMTGKDVANSSVLAVLIMSNQNLINHMINTKFGSFSNNFKEKMQMTLQDALRRAIDNYNLDMEVSFSTYAYRAFSNAKSIDDKEIVPLSLDTTIAGDEQKGLELSDVLGEEDEFIANFAERQAMQDVWGLMGYLHPKNQFIIMAYYGKYCEPMVLTEIGEILNVTKSRVAQVLSKSLELLREMVKDPAHVRLIKSKQIQDRYHLITEEEFNNLLCSSVNAYSR